MHRVVVIVALALAFAFAFDPLGPGATSECDPIADPAVRITSEVLTAGE